VKTVYYISLVLLVLFGCADSTEMKPSKEGVFEVLEIRESYVAGESIKIRFGYEQSSEAVLLVNNAYGMTVLEPQISANEISFELPKAFNENAGSYAWELVENQKTVSSGRFTITPNSVERTYLETYLGPRSISAGNDDFTMMVVSPTDRYDNPVLSGTEVLIKNQFEDKIESTMLKTNTLVAWQRINAREKSGRLLITASCNTTNSKELTSIIFPANGTDFNIDFKRNHSYADGNQIITFSTSKIADEYGNTISDGTLVSFLVTDTSGNQLRTMGTTLDGVAEARLLHPNQKETWSVKSYITGAAQSNAIPIPFESAVKDFEIILSEEKRTVTIGPIKSFMGQLIPDGMPIQLEIFRNGAPIETKTSTSKSGIGRFILTSEFFPEGNYTLEATVSAITKTQHLRLN